jgi:chloramphenicol-sensitive protein RarD
VKAILAMPDDAANRLPLHFMHHPLLAAALAYTLWGLFPLYFRQLQHVGALEIVLHRSIWALAFVLVLLAATRRFGWLGPVLRDRRQLARFSLSALLLSCNWLVYVWAVNHDQVIDASLGYFINPLVSVLLGFVVLRERLRLLQWLAVALAAAGVLWLTVQAGQPPWIALTLALSFGFYGLLRKTATLGALEGLALETLLLAPFAATALVWWAWRNESSVAPGDAVTWLWLLMSGPLTAVTLLLFASGARRLKLATLGLMQYISPTLQFALGVWLFKEPFTAARLAGFGAIWLGLAIYTGEAVRQMRQAEPTVTP